MNICALVKHELMHISAPFCKVLLALLWNWTRHDQASGKILYTGATPCGNIYNMQLHFC